MMSIASIMSSVVPGTFVPDLSKSEAPQITPIPTPPAVDAAASVAADGNAFAPSIAPAVTRVGESGPAPGGKPSSLGAPSVSGDTTFKDTVKGLLADVNDSINTSDQNTRDLASGKTNDVNKVVTSVEEANLALQYTMAIRTKLLEAYTSVQTMSV